MQRLLAHCAAVLVLAAIPAAAAATDVISTRCEESEVVLDAEHTASRLGRCGEQYRDDLLWHLDRIDQISPALDGRFDRRNAGSGVVYLMDTGVMAMHNEFEGPSGTRVIGGYDATKTLPAGNSKCRSDNKALDPCYTDYQELVAASHGTSVASLVAGRNIGVAPAASLVSIRVMNERGLATTRTYLEGLDAIIRHAWSPTSPQFRTAVVNISGWVLERLSGRRADNLPPVAYATVEKKMLQMIEGIDAHGDPDPFGKRFLFVVAGNNLDGGCGRDGVVDRFPAILGPQIDGIITVGGMTEENSWWPGACRGGLEVLAPAHEIFSATITARDHYRGRNPDLRSGTSFAAPIISGIAARLLGERPDLTPRQLEAWITSTPSRIADPATVYADGKVAYTRSIPVTPSVAEQARLAP